MIKRFYKRFLLWVLGPVFEQGDCEIAWIRKPDPGNPWDIGEFTVIPKRT